MSDCTMNFCNMKSEDKSTQVMIAQLTKELQILKTDTTARLLIQDGKIAETCVYIKNNLSNYLKEMLNTLKYTDDIDQIITEALSADLVILNSKTENVVSVDQFGAIGDGITDDTEAIKKALAYFKNKHCTVLFPKGVYVVSGNIELYSNTVIDFNFATIKAKGTTLFLNNPDSMKTDKQGALKNIIFKNGVFVGEDNNIIKIALIHADNVKAENIIFDNCMYGNHVFDLGGCSNVHIDECRFTNVSLRDTGEYVELIQLDYSAYNGMPYFPENSVAYDYRACRNIHISNCVFERGNGSHYPNAIGAHGFFEDQHDNIVVENCIFKGWTYGAIRPLRCNNVSIINNRFETDDLTGTIGAIVIEKGSNSDHIFRPCENVLISGNTFVSTNGSKRRFIFIYGESATAQHNKIVIANNKYKGTYNGVDNGSGSDFAQLNFVNNVTIFGNVIESAKNVLFIEASVSNASLIDNNLVDCRTPITKPATVYVDDGSKSIICETFSTFTNDESGSFKTTLNISKGIKGNKFTVENGSIKIGRGVTLVKASALLQFHTGTLNVGNIQIDIKRTRNGSSVSLASSNVRDVVGFNNCCIPTIVLSVDEGDLIEYQITSSGTGVSFSDKSYITIEEI